MIFQSRTAFVTGAGSGIGRAISLALLKQGANVMLADLSEDGLNETLSLSNGLAGSAAMIRLDVTDFEALSRAAQTTLDQFGKVHMLFNNAGVSLARPAGETPLEDWRWIIDINLTAVAAGVEAFLPALLAHGEGGHICNTASMAGHWAAPGMGPYAATKFAVVGYSESLKQELSERGIGVSILCPGWVKTDIHKRFLDRPSARHLDDKIPDKDGFEFLRAVVESGLDPQDVAEWTLDCIAAGRTYIFTHPEMRSLLDIRHNQIQDDYRACEDWLAQSKMNTSET